MRGERGDPAVGLVRAVALAWFAVGSAGLAHGMTGGHTPDAGPVAVLVAVVGVVAAPLFTHRFARPRAALVVLTTQVLTHLVLTAAARPVPSGAESTAPAAAGHHGKGAGSFGAAGSTPLLDLTPQMVASHLAAAVLVVMVLRAAEESWGFRTAVLRALTVIAPAVLRLLRSASMTPAVAAADRAPVGVRADAEQRLRPRPRDVWRSPVRVRRGPPAAGTA
ncbi:MAG: hypothetical protein ACRCXL_13875 [Dermatophilaceae bacterium]